MWRLTIQIMPSRCSLFPASILLIDVHQLSAIESFAAQSDHHLVIYWTTVEGCTARFAAATDGNWEQLLLPLA